MKLTLPIRTVNTSNVREHWAKRSKRARAHRLAALMSLCSGWPLESRQAWLEGCLVVTLTRVAPRALDDDGNVSSLKSVRDGVADAFGVPDNDPRVVWRYAQRRGAPKTYAVEVEVT